MKKLKNMGSIILLTTLIINFYSCQKEVMMDTTLIQIDSLQLVSKDSILKKDSVIIAPVVTPVVIVPTNPSIEKAAYYIAPNGSDANDGSELKPFKSWTKAWALAKAGDLIYVRGGTYRISGNLPDCAISLKGKNGSAGKMIRLWAYPGEIPVINLNDKIATGYHTTLSITGDYIHIKGLEICYTPMSQGCSSYGFVARDCNNCIFENFNTHHNQGRGLLLTGKSSKNLILNCDSHHNSDPLSTDKYGNADGIAIGLVPAQYGGNVLRGCRSWYNSDDGFDLWGTENDVTIENCWAFDNGYISTNYTKGGDGTGFKLGAAAGPHNNTYKRILKNCLSINNRNIGFAQNNANVAMQFINCTAYKNGLHAFHTRADGIPNYFRNNLDYKNLGKLAINSAAINDHNSWNIGVTITDNNFVSQDQKELLKARKSDGSLPDIQFLKPATNSNLLGKAIDVEILLGLNFKNIIGYAQDSW